jgi:Methyltransferase domain
MKARKPVKLGVDFFLRYAPIVKDLQLSLREDSRILEIGSGAVGLAQFLDDREVIGVDEKEFALEAVSANLTVVRASATRLPFANALFDYVVCVDTLEHVCLSQRNDAIREAVRVTRKKLFITTPTGRTVEQVEKILYLVFAPFYRLFHKDLSFLREHVQNGLPTPESVIHSIETYSPGAEIRVQGNTNLGIWLLSMFFDPVVRFITQRVGSRWLHIMLHPFVPLLNFAPTYRTTFIVSKREQGKVFG